MNPNTDAALPCRSWGRAAFLNPYLVKDMQADCAACSHMNPCRQLAADAPFKAVGVWGGLNLPADRALLPPPTVTGARIYPPNVHTPGVSPYWKKHAIDPEMR